MALKSEREAAKILAVEVKTLTNWRWRGVGPVFIKFPTGAIRYDEAALAAYAAENTFQSTTEAQAAARGRK
jgi:Helix-turn-helix domain